MRTFIAVDFPAELIKKIEGICTFFKQKTPGNVLKWVSADHLHLTIKFIGDINQSKLNQVKKIMVNNLKNHSTFEIQVNGMGMFPNHKAPRVVWLGITGAEPLITINRVLENELSMLDIKPEARPFSPHLTIARVRKNTEPAITKEIGAALSQFHVETLGTAVINEIHLYQSELTPTGPIYTQLYSVPLNQV